MVVGGVFMGKNTVCRALINRFLSLSREAASPGSATPGTGQPLAGVCLLDASVSLPEQAACNVLSCAR